MAKIVVKDLDENLELDRKAMRAITGGRSLSRLALPPYQSGYFQKPYLQPVSDIGLPRYDALKF
jgi:hypothetical protein